MSTNTGCCGGTTTATCDSTIAELPRYYPRQLITPDDLTLEQNYFRDRMRRHNRLLHGWGVACGALVCPAATTNSDGTISFVPWQVKVQKGYALGPYGDEIIIDCCRTIDLRTSGVTGVTGEPCVDAPDPWCSQVYTTQTASNVYYIAVQYKQSMVRPVRVQPVGCGCGDSSCEYSRLQDGYQIGVLSTCPTCNACDQNVTVPSTQTFAVGPIPPCPDCSCGPWVCLAQVTVAADGSGTIAQIDNSSCRRLVLSLCNFWWQSAGTASGAGATTITSVLNSTGTQPQLTAGGNSVTVTVTGTNLEVGANVASGPQVSYSFGPGFTVAVSSPAPTSLLQTGLSSVTLNVTAQTTVSQGAYNLTVVNADCSVVISGNAIQVAAATASTATPAPSAPTNVGAKAKVAAGTQRGSTGAASGNSPSSASKPASRTKTSASPAPES
jgi:hypothetical protein